MVWCIDDKLREFCVLEREWIGRSSNGSYGRGNDTEGAGGNLHVDKDIDDK